MRALRRILVVSSLASLAACGSRSGLLVGGAFDTRDGPSDDTFVARDAAAPSDGAAADTAPVEEADVSPISPLADALPPLDVAAPEPTPSGCPDAAATLVYVVAEDETLLSFDPPTATFATIGKIACPAPAGYAPFSMAVDRLGVAYVLFTNRAAPQSPGMLFRVSLATVSCQATSFVSGQNGFDASFGMAFARDASDAGETLYVIEGLRQAGVTGATHPPPARLASIDTTTFTLRILATAPPTVQSAELTGTGAGDLFGFYSLGEAGSAIGQIDKTTGALTGQAVLAGLQQGKGWAFGFWGGDFYAFTGQGNSSTTSVVTRFRPTNGSAVPITTTPRLIVGAGVSTCAPQQ